MFRTILITTGLLAANAAAAQTYSEDQIERALRDVKADYFVFHISLENGWYFECDGFGPISMDCYMRDENDVIVAATTVPTGEMFGNGELDRIFTSQIADW